jgi:hypothetical protein
VKHLCNVEGCTQTVRCKGLCHKHYCKVYYAANKQRYRNYDKAHLVERREQGRIRERDRRAKVLEHLGNRCNNPACRWLNEDGSLGCKDPRALQIDHVRGGGHQEMVELNCCNYRLCQKVLLDTAGTYQLLCANCNWIKRHINGEHARYLTIQRAA